MKKSLSLICALLALTTVITFTQFDLIGQTEKRTEGKPAKKKIDYKELVERQRAEAFRKAKLNEPKIKLKAEKIRQEAKRKSVAQKQEIQTKMLEELNKTEYLVQALGPFNKVSEDRKREILLAAEIFIKWFKDPNMKFAAKEAGQLEIIGAHMAEVSVIHWKTWNRSNRIIYNVGSKGFPKAILIRLQAKIVSIFKPSEIGPYRDEIFRGLFRHRNLAKHLSLVFLTDQVDGYYAENPKLDPRKKAKKSGRKTYIPRTTKSGGNSSGKAVQVADSGILDLLLKYKYFLIPVPFLLYGFIKMRMK